MNFRFPDASSRVSICGATGSGKTRFAAWLFSYSAFSVRPYVIVDFKGDDLIARIGHAREITLKEKIRHPGLYVIRPTPHETAEVDSFLWRVWERGNCGLWFDEGYMVNKSQALDAILTQGRSKKIPCTILTQRPVWCSRFVFSEASYYAVFRLNDQRDYDTIRGFTPRNETFDFQRPLPKFTARWYDVGRDWSALIDPVPNDDAILARYEAALKIKHRGI